MIVKPNKVQPPGNGLRCPYGCYVTFWRWYGLVAHLMDKHGYSEKKAEKVADKAIPYDPDPEPAHISFRDLQYVRPGQGIRREDRRGPGHERQDDLHPGNWN